VLLSVPLVLLKPIPQPQEISRFRRVHDARRKAPQRRQRRRSEVLSRMLSNTHNLVRVSATHSVNLATALLLQARGYATSIERTKQRILLATAKLLLSYANLAGSIRGRAARIVLA
jgi:hypothetical protein